MTTFQILLGTLVGVFIAVIVERACYAFKRKIEEDRNRALALIFALREQRLSLEEILSHGSLSVGLRSLVLEMISKAIGSKNAAKQLAAWIDKGEPKPDVLPCQRRLQREWLELFKRDPEVARLSALLGRELVHNEHMRERVSDVNS